MLLGFQERFAQAVELGLMDINTKAAGMWRDSTGFLPNVRRKRQTIRAPRKDGKVANVGDTLKIYTGLRTKKCRKLGEATCLQSSRVMVNRVAIFVFADDGQSARQYFREEADEFARDDGFKDFAELRAWLDKTHGQGQFRGQLYRW